MKCVKSRSRGFSHNHGEVQGACKVRAGWVQTCVLRDGQLHSSGAIPVEASHVSAVAAAEGSHILVAGALTAHT